MAPKKENYTNAAEMFISTPEPVKEAPQKPAPKAKRKRPAKNKKSLSMQLKQERKKILKDENAKVRRGFQVIEEYKTERMQILVKPSTKKALTSAARKHGLSMNAYINKVLEESISE